METDVIKVAFLYDKIFVSHEMLQDKSRTKKKKNHKCSIYPNFGSVVAF